MFFHKQLTASHKIETRFLLRKKLTGFDGKWLVNGCVVAERYLRGTKVPFKHSQHHSDSTATLVSIPKELTWLVYPHPKILSTHYICYKIYFYLRQILQIKNLDHGVAKVILFIS
jgi:hypothetical protein